MADQLWKTDEKGPFLLTVRGELYLEQLEDMELGGIEMRDIIFSLAHTPRYRALTGGLFLSVAEHSVRAAAVAMVDHTWPHDRVLLARAALLHDAAEAVIGDIPKPLKDQLLYTPSEKGTWDFNVVERSIQRRILKKLNEDSPRAMPEISLRVKEIDELLYLVESLKIYGDRACREIGLPTVSQYAVAHGFSQGQRDVAVPGFWEADHAMGRMHHLGARLGLCGCGQRAYEVHDKAQMELALEQTEIETPVKH